MSSQNPMDPDGNGSNDDLKLGIVSGIDDFIDRKYNAMLLICLGVCLIEIQVIVVAVAVFKQIRRHLVGKRHILFKINGICVHVFAIQDRQFCFYILYSNGRCTGQFFCFPQLFIELESVFRYILLG